MARIIEIQPMNCEHIPTLARLEQICFEHPWSQQALADELDINLTAAEDIKRKFVYGIESGDEKFEVPGADGEKRPARRLFPSGTKEYGGKRASCIPGAREVQ